MSDNLGPQDDHSHKPTSDERWQESWACMYFDPVTRVAGYHHTGLQPVRGIADCWSWFAVRGQLVTNYSRLTLPHPKDDYSDLRLGPLHVKSLVPNLKRSIRMKDDKVESDVIYEAFVKEPIDLHTKKGGPMDDIGKGHLESMGTVKGTLKVGGETIEIDGFGYDDRSWGVRVWDNMQDRIIHACFGPDLYCCLYHVSLQSGDSQFGWVCDQGVFQNVRSLDFTVEVNNDGVTARGAKVKVWTEGGRGYSLTARCDGGSVINQRDNFLASPAMCEVEYGGRLGIGLLEFAELKKATPALIKKYGLDTSLM